ncbi:MAG: C10 family peptidase [Bacteroidales bacterium]|nr:C10 family peptidase [Bacteroidales bacterium]
MSRFLCAVLLLVFSLSVFAGPVDEATARRIASNFIAFQASKIGVASVKSNNAMVQVRSKGDINYYYVINYQQGGFVVVSADDAAIPVLAYSFDENLDMNNMSPATREWLGQFEQQFDMLFATNPEPVESITTLWSNLYNNQLSAAKETQGVNKLVQTRWNQDYPYNKFCPFHPLGPGERCYAGCVATAMSQVMKYYNYPETGRFQKTYFWGDYFTIDFGATTYQWDLMTITANADSQDAIAELMYHCGVASNMNYGYDGSGTQVELAMYALKYYFRYRADCYFADKDDYEDADWKFMLKMDLDMGKPIIYRGTNNNGDGHAFVCDGYQDTSYFHFNWGWGGAADGFYHLGGINPSISFYWGQGAIFNLNPYEAAYCDTLVLDQREWKLTDGSGPNYYWNNSACTWLIAPEEAEKIDIRFNEFNTEPANDILYIYDGPDDNAPLLGAFSGFSLPENIQSSTGQVFLKFITNGFDQYMGWELEYAVNTTDIATSGNAKINIYPNPTVESVMINHGVSCHAVEIVNIHGSLAMHHNCTGDQTQLDVSSLPQGLYIVRLLFDNQIIVRKLNIQ